MSSRQNYNFPGVTQLVQQETTQGGFCFYVDKDYQFYLQLMQECATEYNCHIHAYALLPDKTLLLITPYADSAVSQMMHALSQRYTDYINRTYGRNESLWRSGYLSCLLEADEYLFDCMRYIELSSVRQAQVNKVEDWAWSSYHCNALNKADSLITAHSTYTSVADDAAGCAAVYEELIRLKIRDEEDIEEIDATLKQGGILGSSEFRQKYSQLDSVKNADGEWGCVMCY